MKLTNVQRKKLHEALLDAFPTQVALAKLLNFELDLNLAAVAGSGPLDDVVVRLIEWFESHGRVEDMLTSACATAPLNTLLQEVSAEILSRRENTDRGLSLQTLLQWLPAVDDRLFGRDDELKWLDKCFQDPAIGVVALTAFGGVGKTALVRHWLRTRFSSMPSAAPRFVFIGCSFFSQGTRERAGTSDQFLYEWLKLLGDPEPTKGSAWIRAKRLAAYCSREPTILVLDGLEPLQYGTGQQDLEGRFKDPGIRELLSSLIANHGHAFCIVTSRLEINEPFLKGPACIHKPLDLLSDSSAERILRYRGLHGTSGDFQKAVRYLGHHPLALVLAAEYLNTFEGAEVGRIQTIPLINEETRAGRHAKSVMAAYETAFAKDGNLLDVEFLKLLGLFDRPIKWSWIEALRSGPRIGGFVKFGATEGQELIESVTRLRKSGLLSYVVEEEIVDAHPLIREYFGSKLRVENPDGWRDANEKLYRYFREIAIPLPSTVEAMESLLLAVTHGCRSGKYHEALHDVYIKRIMRGPEAFAVVTLNLIGPLLAVLAQFFENKDWLRPIARSPMNPEGLAEESQIYVLSQVGYFIKNTKGYAVSEVEEIFNLAAQLCLQVNDKKSLFQIKYGIWTHDSAKGDLDKSLDEGSELLTLAQELHNDEYTVAAYRALATSSYRLGDFRKSLEYATSGVEIRMDGNHPAQLQAHFGDDPSVNCECFAAMSLWHLGFPDKARERQHHALETARRGTSAHGLAVAFYLGSYVYDFCQEYESSQTIAEEMIKLASEYGFKMWLGAGLIRRGWALSMLGNVDEGIVVLKEGLYMWRSTKTGIGMPYWNYLLAEVLQKSGRYLEAGGFIDQAILLLNESKERWWEPELYRLKGKIFLEQAINEEEAEECFRRALDISKKRSDKSLELRAARSLSSYLYAVGKRKDALQLLTQSLEGFAEDLDTRDLREARESMRLFVS